MNRHYLLIIAFLFASSFLSSCKQTMPTQSNLASASFQVEPSGDIIFNGKTGSVTSLRFKIKNLTSDSIILNWHLTPQPPGSIDLGFDLSGIPLFYLAPHATDTSLIKITFHPRIPGNDTFPIIITSSAGDSITKVIIGHATGDSLSIPTSTKYLATVNFSNIKFHVIDSSFTWASGGNEMIQKGVHDDTSVYSLSLSSTGTYWDDTIWFSYDDFNDQIPVGGGVDNNDRSVFLTVVFDTNLHVAKKISFQDYTSQQIELNPASNPRSNSDLVYSFNFQNLPYTILKDGSFDIVIGASDLASSVTTFKIISSHFQSNYSFAGSSGDFHNGNIVLPSPSNALLHINLKKL